MATDTNQRAQDNSTTEEPTDKEIAKSLYGLMGQMTLRSFGIGCASALCLVGLIATCSIPKYVDHKLTEYTSPAKGIGKTIEYKLEDLERLRQPATKDLSLFLTNYKDN